MLLFYPCCPDSRCSVVCFWWKVDRGFVGSTVTVSVVIVAGVVVEVVINASQTGYSSSSFHLQRDTASQSSFFSLATAATKPTRRINKTHNLLKINDQ